MSRFENLTHQLAHTNSSATFNSLVIFIRRAIRNPDDTFGAIPLDQKSPSLAENPTIFFSNAVENSDNAKKNLQRSTVWPSFPVEFKLAIRMHRFQQNMRMPRSCYDSTA